MKTYLTYGFVWALGTTLLTLILHFLGYHSDPAKLGSAQLIMFLAGTTITVASIILGTKARRAETPSSEDFGYGSAFVAGLMISLFAAIFSVGTNYLYGQVINPDFQEVMVQAQITKMEAKGMSGAQLEQAEQLMRKMSAPAFQMSMAFVVTMIFGTVISLITAAFLKRRASDHPPIIA